MPNEAEQCCAILGNIHPSLWEPVWMIAHQNSRDAHS
jgi:hypothetical protein